MFLKQELLTTYSVTGFDKKNRLVLGKYSLSEIIDMNIRDSSGFKPILVLNGKPTPIIGNGGWGIAPRTAIGQKKSGEILFVVIDGRQLTHSLGCTIRDLQNILLKYGAYNAANLDGGTSSIMVYDHRPISHSCSNDNPYGRRIPSAYLIR